MVQLMQENPGDMVLKKMLLDKSVPVKPCGVDPGWAAHWQEHTGQAEAAFHVLCHFFCGHGYLRVDHDQLGIASDDEQPLVDTNLWCADAKRTFTVHDGAHAPEHGAVLQAHAIAPVGGDLRLVRGHHRRGALALDVGRDLHRHLARRSVVDHALRIVAARLVLAVNGGADVTPRADELLRRVALRGRRDRTDGPNGRRNQKCAKIAHRSPARRDVLRFEEFLEALVRALAADARLLHAAKRRGWIGHEATIETDHAEVELLGDAQAATQVLRVEIRDETVFGVVGDLDGLLLGAEGEKPLPPKGSFVLDINNPVIEEDYGRSKSMISYKVNGWREDYYAVIVPEGYEATAVDMEVTGRCPSCSENNDFGMQIHDFPLPRDNFSKWLGTLYGQTRETTTIKKASR
mgnify:CR=1 FL=1